MKLYHTMNTMYVHILLIHHSAGMFLNKKQWRRGGGGLKYFSNVKDASSLDGNFSRVTDL